MRKFIKAISAIAMLLMTGVVLSACTSSATRKAPQTSQQQGAETTAQNTKFKLYRGTFLQSNGVISVPIIADNGSNKDIMLASRNIKLYVDGQKVDMMQVKDQPSDFHDTVASSNKWNNIISFYVGTTLSKKDLDNCQVAFTNDNGQKIIAQPISADKVSTLLSDSTSTGTNNDDTLSTYYQNMIDFQKNQLSDSRSTESLENRFNDSKYDNLHSFAITSTKHPDEALIFIYNGTNTDFVLNLSNLEVIDDDGSETMVDPEFRNYQIRIPHGKYVNAVIKFEAKLSDNLSPYQVRLKDKDGNFFDTKKSPYPIQFAINNSTKYEEALSGAPDELNSDAVKWSKAKLKGKTLTVNVRLISYFNLKAEKISDYKLVGIDNDGNEGDVEKAVDGAPLTIDTSDTVKLKLKFDDLKNLKTYKHIYLYYRDQELAKVK